MYALQCLYITQTQQAKDPIVHSSPIDPHDSLDVQVPRVDSSSSLFSSLSSDGDTDGAFTEVWNVRHMHLNH